MPAPIDYSVCQDKVQYPYDKDPGILKKRLAFILAARRGWCQPSYYILDTPNLKWHHRCEPRRRTVLEARSLSLSTVLRWTDKQCHAYLEKVRWPDGPICPECGTSEHYRITRKTKTKNKVDSLYKCRACRRQFTVTVGTIFEGSKIPLSKWFAAIYTMCAFKRGVGAQQVHIQARVTYKSAWFMCRRVREAMLENGHSPLLEPATSVAQQKRSRRDRRIKLNLSFEQGLATLARKYGGS